MAIPILHFWQKYFYNHDEGLGSTYERFIINEILYKAVNTYRIKSIIETPSFGFTGLSGINSLGLAAKNLEITVTDSEPERLKLIKDIWAKTNYKANFDLVRDYSLLPYGDSAFDMAWNFSALWFVPELDIFLKELSRISRKIILIMIPNRSGLGYLFQKYTGRNDLKIYLKEDNLKPKYFINELKKHGWTLMHDSLIDCPLWPDIGMSKGELMRRLGLSFLSPSRAQKAPSLTILDYYDGSNPSLKDDMLKYNLFENKAPLIFKKFWAHHHYFLFLKKNNYEKFN